MAGDVATRERGVRFERGVGRGARYCGGVVDG